VLHLAIVATQQGTYQCNLPTFARLGQHDYVFDSLVVYQHQKRLLSSVADYAERHGAALAEREKVLQQWLHFGDFW
jgi:hypothetical protein